jgi:hypothetical protein
MMVGFGLAIYDVDRDGLECIADIRPRDLAHGRSGDLVSDVSWSPGGTVLSLTRKLEGQEPKSESYRFDGSGWVRSEQPARSEVPQPTVTASSKASELSVEVREDQNRPPEVVARVGSSEVSLFGKDPALQGVALQQFRPFAWTGPDGSKHVSGLLLPAGYKPGQPVPIVIQPYSYVPELFQPDGSSTTGDAAQALAARGIGVLIDNSVVDLLARQDNSNPDLSPEDEGPQFVERIDAIVDALVSQGISNGSRIGLLGFSRGGHETYFQLTHPGRHLMSAVAIMDGMMGSYPDMFRNMADSSNQPWGFGATGRTPWQNPYYWLTFDYGLNTDRVLSPALFAKTHQGIPATDDPELEETVGAFWLAGDKPLDTLQLAPASHNLSMPLQRAALMANNVDWFAFWLKGEEDPAPSKYAQYLRWRQIRDDWAQTQAKEAGRPQDGFIKTRAGLYYRIDDPKLGRALRSGDKITIDYVVKPLDGAGRKPISSHATLAWPSPPQLLPVGVVTPDRDTRPVKGLGMGWFQGLGILHDGESATFIMPAALAQGVDGTAGFSPQTMIQVEVKVRNMEFAPATGT